MDFMYMARKSAQEMVDYSNKLAGIEVESILERERNWYGKTKQVEYLLINGDIKSEIFFTSKSIYYKRDAEYYFHIHYHKNGNISSITEGFIDEPVGGSTHLQGTNIHFFKNGNIELDRYYKPAGCLSGYYKSYHPNGKIAITGRFVNDGHPVSQSPDGKWVWYYENGIIGKKIYFKRGFCIGEFLWYDKDGYIIKRKRYREEDAVGVKDISGDFSVKFGGIVSNFSYR